MAAPYRLLKIRRGLKADLPILAEGEFGYCTDSKELFIGTSSGNGLVPVYTATTPGDWAGMPPVTAQDAIDRISSALAAELGGPIP